MKLGEIIDALKSFFLDFLGYFLPGMYGIILLSYVIDIKMAIWHGGDCLYQGQ